MSVKFLAVPDKGGKCICESIYNAESGGAVFLGSGE